MRPFHGLATGLPFDAVELCLVRSAELSVAGAESSEARKILILTSTSLESQVQLARFRKPCETVPCKTMPKSFPF